MWWYGKPAIPDPALPGIAAEEFDKWRKQGGFGLYIYDYTVTDAEKDGSSVIVSGTINGEPFKMRIPEKGHITWR